MEKNKDELVRDLLKSKTRNGKKKKAKKRKLFSCSIRRSRCTLSLVWELSKQLECGGSDVTCGMLFRGYMSLVVMG